MKTVLVTWIGATDLRAPVDTDTVGVGPIAQALDGRTFDEVYLVSDYPPSRVKPYVEWLQDRSSAKIKMLAEKLSGPTNFGEIYEAAVRACEIALGKQRDNNTALVFHMSPGTPAMAAVWVILAKTRFPAELLELSREYGVRTASVPFDISADFIPDLLREQDEKLRRLSGGKPPQAPEFNDIVHRSRVMSRVIDRGRRVAVRNVPVLIEGESGTGKELFARAIHRASARRKSLFVALNCGAVPAELIESQLFGHERGAFTGATQARKGYFEAADKGSLFLDEIGELPLPAQVKLLRVVQESEIVHGSTQSVKVDVRIIAATNRTLTDEVTAGRFREDLYYRLAVAVLKVPPVRERAGDISLLVEHILELVNEESGSEPGYKQKKLSAGARNLLLNYSWPGNVRELQNTLRRAAIWSDDETVTVEDIREAMMPPPTSSGEAVLNRPLGEELSLPDLLSDVAGHYMNGALEEAAGNKTRAAELVGLSSYQTFTNWMKKYGIRAGTKTA